MAASTNTLSVGVRQQDANGTDIISGAPRTVSFSFAGSAGQYTESLNVPTTGVTVTVPISPCLQLYIKNLDPTNYVSVTWTTAIGGSNFVKSIRPGGFLAFSDLDTAAGSAGISVLTLQANTAACKVEMFLGG